MTPTRLPVAAWVFTCVCLSVLSVVQPRAETPLRGELYALCNLAFEPRCNDKVLMLKDVCRATVEFYDREKNPDKDKQSWCSRVREGQRDAYVSTLEPPVRSALEKAWRAGR